MPVHLYCLALRVYEWNSLFPILPPDYLFCLGILAPLHSMDKGEKSSLVTAPAKLERSGNAKFVADVRCVSKITLGEAKAYAAGLSPVQHRFGACKCFSMKCPVGARYCAGKLVGWTCPINWCGSCICTPCLVCMCAPDAAVPGVWSCVDLKGNFYALVKVDVERDTWAWFSENQAFGTKGDNLGVCCYCT